MSGSGKIFDDVRKICKAGKNFRFVYKKLDYLSVKLLLRDLLDPRLYLGEEKQKTENSIYGQSICDRKH